MVYSNNVIHKGPAVDNAIVKTAGYSSGPSLTYDLEIWMHTTALAETYPSPETAAWCPVENYRILIYPMTFHFLECIILSRVFNSNYIFLNQ